MTKNMYKHKSIILLVLAISILFTSVTPVLAIEFEDKSTIVIEGIKVLDEYGVLTITGKANGAVKGELSFVKDNENINYPFTVEENGAFIISGEISKFLNGSEFHIKFENDTVNEIIDISSEVLPHILKVEEELSVEEEPPVEEELSEGEEPPIEEELSEEEEPPVEEELSEEEEPPVEDEVPEEEIPNTTEEVQEEIEDDGLDDFANHENPDNLSGPEKGNPNFIYLDEGDSPLVKPMISKSLNLRNRAQGSSPTTPGEVSLFKTVEEVDGYVNVFKVTMRMEAMDSVKSNDIVLVIDTSGSMAGTRLTNAKAAATQFVNQLLDENHPNTRISIVSFASSVTSHTGFLNYTGKQTLLNAINGFSAGGGTLTQGGVKIARDKLGTSNADYKNIVLLSDGDPTFSYAINQGYRMNTANLISYPDRGWQTATTTPKDMYIYNNVVGTGSALHQRYDNPWGTNNDKWYNNGNSAIAEAGFAKDSEYSMHTIALSAGTTGTSILNQMASPGKAYTTSDPAELTPIFGSIASSIQSAMQNAQVTDPMGTGFNVTGGYVTGLAVTQGTATVSSDNNSIDWNVGTLTTPISPGSNIKYAELTYEVEINDSILEVTSPTGEFYTNGDASVSYTDSNGNLKTEYFPQPTANPLIIKMEKVLLDAKGNEIPETYANPRLFNFNMTMDGTPLYNKDYLVGGNLARVMTDIRNDETYKFVENSISGTPVTVFNDYNTKIKWETWDGTDKMDEVAGNSIEGFKIPRSGTNEPLDTTITVTNQEKPLGKLKISKEFNSTPMPAAAKGMGLMAISEPEFIVKIVGTNIYNSTETVYDETRTIKAGETITLENLVYGEYTVTETVTNGFVPNYVDSQGDDRTDGKVEITVDDKNQNVTITNRPQAGETDVIDFEAKKHWVGGDIKDHIAVKLDLYKDGVLMTDAPEPTVAPSTGTSSTFTYTWKNLPKYNDKGGLAEYTVKEPNTPQYYKVTYNLDNTEVTNTFESPENGTVELTKVWNDAEDEKVFRPNVKLTLYRTSKTTDETITDEIAHVPDGQKNPIIINDDNGYTDLVNEKYKWEGLTEYNTSGNLYSYYVVEEFINKDVITDQNWILAEEAVDGKVSVEDGKVTVTNRIKTANDGLGSLEVQKILKNELETAVRKSLQVVEPIVFTIKVTDSYGIEKTVDLKAGETKTLENIYFGEYSIVETVTHGYTPSYNPTSLKVEMGQTTTPKFVVTNSRQGGDTDPNSVTIKIDKEWVNGPKPDTTIELWRKGQSVDGTEIDEKVKEFTATSTILTATFTELALHDPSGRVFDYYVKEAQVTDYDEPVIVESGTATETNFKVTNTFNPVADGEVKVTKVWNDAEDEKVFRPNVKITLYRTATEIDEAVPDIAAFIPSVDKKVNNEEYTWSNLVTKTDDGEEYKFYVKEEFIDELITNENWIINKKSKVANGAVIVENSIKLGDEDDNDNPTDPVDPPTVPETENRLGRIQIEKLLVGNKNDNTIFTFIITDSYGIETTVRLKADQIATLTNMYYGNYSIREISSAEYTPSYNVKTVELSMKDETTPRFVVTNRKNEIPSDTIRVTGIKVWDDGYSSEYRPTIWLKLNRKIENGILETVPNSIQELKNTVREVSWNVPERDSQGRLYIYSVQEVNSAGDDYTPYGYEKTESGMRVTNRRYSGIPDIFGPVLNKNDHFAYVIGYPDGSFRADSTITRAEMTAIFSRLIEEEIFLDKSYSVPFSDVSPEAWYTEYIGMLSSVRVISGYPDGTFRPENPVTRAEFATVAARFIANKKSRGGFPDVSNTYWARESIEIAKAEGWITGYPDGTFRPDANISRAEVVNIVNKMLDRNADKNYVDSHRSVLYDYTDLNTNYWAYYQIMEASNGHNYTRLSNKNEKWDRHWTPYEQEKYAKRWR